MLLTRGRGAEVYLVERAPELAFFGGYQALPGGNVDPRDGADEERALRVCAARELFEETGVLPPGLAAGLDPGRRAHLRRDLCAGAPGAARFWELVAAAPDALAPLRAFGRLTTPPFAPVRYRTRLFHLELPPGEEPRIDPGELCAGRFVRPADELARWTRGEARIAPPVTFLLEELAARGLEPALAAAGAVCDELEAGALHPVRAAPGLWMAPLRTPTVPPATTTNTYFVGDEALYVVDPATPYPDEQERLFACMDRFCAAGRRFAGILVTHHHADHVGAVAAASARYGLPVHGHRLTLDRLPPGFRRGRALLDGDALELGTAPDGAPGWRLAALHTPGHDRGHLIFVDSRYGFALAGDLVSTLSTIVIDPPEGHMATYLASLARARDLDLALLCPAHGPTATRPRALLAGFLAHRAAREEKLVRALAAGARSPAELLPAVYDDVEHALAPLAARSLAAGLEKLAEERRARERADGRWELARA